MFTSINNILMVIVDYELCEVYYWLVCYARDWGFKSLPEQKFKILSLPVFQPTML